MGVGDSKRELRRRTIERILALDPAVRSAQEGVLASKFAALPGLDRAGTVLLYATAFREEIDTWPMIAEVLEAGRRLVCPRVDRRERRLRLFVVEDLQADLERGTLGIPEPRTTLREVAPIEVDWVLVPGLAFDPRGYRLGRGAGHYDRLLPTLRPDVPRWALCLDAQWVEELPIEPHDVPLDGIVSPSKAEIPGRH
jgi:5-formyltetrahydrofolate cyclo-ligase